MIRYRQKIVGEQTIKVPSQLKMNEIIEMTKETEKSRQIVDVVIQPTNAVTVQQIESITIITKDERNVCEDCQNFEARIQTLETEVKNMVEKNNQSRKEKEHEELLGY
jgi:hypothetical protein